MDPVRPTTCGTGREGAGKRGRQCCQVVAFFMWPSSISVGRAIGGPGSRAAARALPTTVRRLGLAPCSAAPPFTRALVNPADLVEVGPLGYMDPP